MIDMKQAFDTHKYVSETVCTALFSKGDRLPLYRRIDEGVRCGKIRLRYGCFNRGRESSDR